MKRMKYLVQLFLMLTVAVLSACSGGSDSSPPADKVTITGAVTFPVTGDQKVAKTTALTVADQDIKVEVYDLTGKLITMIHPTYDDATTGQRIYAYSIPNLPANTDYVIKVTNGLQILKKLFEKKDLPAGTVSGQTVDAVSTTAVAIASQQLTSSLNLVGSHIVLGDPLPTLPAGTDLSTKISIEVKPFFLEQSISAAVNGSSANLTSETASLVNIFNIVVTSVVDNVDATTVLSGETQLTTMVPMFAVVAGSPVTVTSTAIQTTTVATLVTAAATSYTPPATITAATYITQAQAALAAQDISNAYLNYEKALAADPNDKEANFGSAITSGMMLMEDADVKAIVTKWGGVLPTVNQMVQGTSPVKLPFGNMTSVTFKAGLAKTTAKATTAYSTTQDVLAAFNALKGSLPQQKTGFKSVAKQLNLVPATAPTVSEMQAVIDNVIIPRIDKILARLAKVEGIGYSFTVTKAMQGNPLGEDIVLSDGEFYTLDAALNCFQILFKIATAYNFDLPAGYTYDTISQDPLAFINSSSFFTLKADGSAKMNAALTYAKGAAAKAQKAYDAVVVRTLGQGTFDLSDWTTIQKTDFTTALADITSSLQGAKVWTIDGKAVTIDATKFFTSPLTKAKLPTFGYDVPRNAALSLKYGNAVAAEKTYTDYWNVTRTDAIHSDIVPTSDLPDFSLNGILPGNTAANNVAGFNGILPVIGGKLLSNLDQNIWYVTNDGTSIYYLGSDNNTGARLIQKINPATGDVTTVATASNEYLEKLLWHNGSFYSVAYDGLYPITIDSVAKTFTVGTTLALPSPQLDMYQNLTDIVSSGSDLYYGVATWNQLTWTESTAIHKVSNAFTAPSDSLLVTIPDWVDRFAFYNGFLYTDGDKRNPAASYGVVASYPNAESAILVGGYFYDIYDAKIIKMGGTPAGGVAKLSGLLGKFF